MRIPSLYCGAHKAFRRACLAKYADSPKFGGAYVESLDGAVANSRTSTRLRGSVNIDSYSLVHGQYCCRVLLGLGKL